MKNKKAIMWNLLSTNHILMSMFYMLVGLMGGSIGWGLSVMISIELGLPGFAMASSLSYNSVMTFHGMYMMFFMIMPLLMGGFGNSLIPLMLCSSDMMFPRMNALSLWLVGNSLLLVS